MSEDKEFIRTLREGMHVWQRFHESQRLRAGVDLDARERLLLKILKIREDRLLKSLPATKLAAEYNKMALDRMNASESTICAVLVSLKKRGFVKNSSKGKAKVDELDKEGKNFLTQDEKMLEERLKIYLEVCPDSQERATVKKFFKAAARELEYRMAAWQKGL